MLGSDLECFAGVAGAGRAGMRCLAVTNTRPRDSLGEADLIVDSLEEVTVDDLEGFVRRPGE